MRIRSALFITAGAVGAAIGGAAIATAFDAALDDPETIVAPVALNGVAAEGTVAPGATPGTGSGASPAADAVGVTVRQVDGLDELVGTLRSGDDPEDWYVSGVEVDFGPDGWISAAPAFEDYDADGTSEPLLDELRGLEGREVTLGIRYEIDDDRDDADAFVIEGLAYRDPTGAPAPWQSAPAGAEATAEEVAEAAAAAVGEGAVARDVEREDDDGWLGWDVEVRGADGRDYDVHLDLSGTVTDVRPEDD